MGGLVASALAVEYPELVTALVLVDPGYGYTDETSRRSLRHCVSILKMRLAHCSPGCTSTRHRPGNAFGIKGGWERTRVDLIAEAFCAGFEGPNGVGHRSLAGPYLSGRQCPVLSVHSGASAALLAAWEKALPHGPDDEVVEWNECGTFSTSRKAR